MRSARRHLRDARSGHIRLSKIVDPDSGRLIAYSLQGSYGRPRTIWMDGRPHPSDLAPHTWAGFSTGRWERNTLVVTTTHIKAGWLQRNGAPTSDLATMTEFFTRYDDYLLLVSSCPERPGVPGRAVHPHDELRAEPRRQRQRLGYLQPRTGGRRAAGPQDGTRAPLPARADGAHRRFPEGHRAFPRRARAAGPRRRIPNSPRSCSSQGGAAPRSTRTAGGTRARVACKPCRPPPGEVRVQPVQGNVYLLAGAGGNIAVQVGKDGVLARRHGLGTDDRQGARRPPSAVRPADPLHPQHARPSRPRGRQRGDREGRKPCRRRPRRRRPGRHRRVGDRATKVCSSR